ncbi:MAG: PTS sugar transporter subunit IIA [Syntrophobacterales bacterium]|nr:PTS sugar transporter subunit IIA [Syntrophobacterales bacterium]
MNKLEITPTVGVIIITHCGLAEELLRTAEIIVGSMDGFHALSIRPAMSQDEIFSLVERKIKEADRGKGVLILTDIFGGTPTNVALAFSGPHVDVVCGVNLPMIIKAYSSRNSCNLHELAALVQEYGKRHIARANELLEPE